MAGVPRANLPRSRRVATTMEGLEVDMGALALEPEQGQESGEASARSAGRDRERALSAAIEEQHLALLSELVDLDCAFHELMALGERLESGELRLRSVIDVGGDLDGSEDGAAAGALSAPVRRTLAAFRRVAKLRQGYRRLQRSKSARSRAGQARLAARRAELVASLRALSIH